MKKNRKKPSPQPKIVNPANYALIGLATLLVARPLVPEDPGGQAGYGVAFVLLWLLLAAGWAVQCWRSQRPIAPPDLADFLMLGLICWHTVSALVAAAQGSPRPAVTMLWEWACMGLTFLLARRILTTGTAARGVVTVMVGLAAGLSLVAVEQRFVSMPRDHRAFEQARHDPAKLYELTGQWLPPSSPELARFESRLTSQQPSATFALTNSLAGYLVPWSVLLAAVLLNGEFWTNAGRLRITLGGLVLIVILSTLVLTGSRTAILAAAAGMTGICTLRAMKVAHRRSLFKVVAVFMAFAGCSAILAFQGGMGRDALNGAARSFAFRVEYWQATLRMIADRPLLGGGPGQFQNLYTRYKLPAASEEIQDPHNWLLEVTATAGIPAGILVCLLLMAIAWRIARPLATLEMKSELEGSNRLEPFIGAACGLVLGLVLAFTNGFSPSLRQLALIAVGIGAVWWVLRPWLRSGKLEPIAVLIAVAALLLNLTASGGIGYPSIAETLWLLAAIGLRFKGGRRDAVLISADHRVLARTALIIAALALFVAAYATSYRPVTTSRAWLSRADAAFLSGQLREQAAAVEAAAAADRWSADAARRLLALRLAEFQQNPRAEQRESLTGAVHRMLSLAPRNSGAWRYASEVALAVYRQSGERHYFELAIAHLRRAIERYPASPALYSQLANLLNENGARSAATDAAKEALHLDELMRAAGHADRRLNEEEQKKLREIAGGGAAFDGAKP
ncbi:MAG: O-antigen ligase family protein [Pirellulales bacterium]